MNFCVGKTAPNWRAAPIVPEAGHAGSGERAYMVLA